MPNDNDAAHKKTGRALLDASADLAVAKRAHAAREYDRMREALIAVQAAITRAARAVEPATAAPDGRPVAAGQGAE